jgi:hypothetical protein
MAAPLAAWAGTWAASVALLNPQTNQWDFAEAFSANDGNLLTGRQEVGVVWLQCPTNLSAPRAPNGGILARTKV